MKTKTEKSVFMYQLINAYTDEKKDRSFGLEYTYSVRRYVFIQNKYENVRESNFV